MMISKAWKRKVLSNVAITNKYCHLFEMRTPYQSSVIDGIHLLSKGPLKPDFLSLMKTCGTHNYLPSKSPYRESYSLGCVALMFGPRFSRVVPYKLKINPSEGGLSLRQVLDWANFATGNAANLLVKRVDFKIELFNYNPVHCMNTIWASGFRTIDDRYKDQSLYLGGRRSNRSIIVYDKANQSRLSKVVSNQWTRVEVREKHTTQKQLSLYTFIRSLRKTSPFQDLVMLEAGQAELNVLLNKYKKALIGGSVVKSLKQLNSYQRKAVIKKLDGAGKVVHLSLQYKRELQSWLKY